MLSVIICEDNPKQRKRIETIIKNYIMIEDLDMELTLSTDDPQQVLEHVKDDPKQVRLYFFDVDLQHELSGIALAYEIRKIDNIGKIIFVTTHSEMSYLTFTYKIEAMDYI
ncbi:response regulator, partial [Enterococcus faecalis]